jgi:uncharacterized coiled-coil protein SlyX
MMRGTVELPAAAAGRHLRGIAARIANLPRDADGMRSRLKGERDKQSRRHNALHQLINKLLQWQRQLPAGVTLESAPPVTVELKSGEKLSDVIAATRNEIAALRQRLDVTKRTPLPLPDMKQLADVARLARIGRPTVAVQRDSLRAVPREVDMLSPEGVMRFVLATVAWVAPESLLAALEREIDALPERADALSAAEREPRVGEIEREIEQRERYEESLIMRAF